MPPVGIVVDNPRRDLEGAVLLASALARRGRPAILVPLYAQGADIPLLGLEGVVLNYLRLNNAALARSYKRLGMRLFVMDTEGGVLSAEGADAPANWAAWLASSGLGELADRYFCWGNEVADAFRAAMPDKDFHVTGCPRYDLCDPAFRNYFEYPVRDFVLVNTNFSALNPSLQRRADDEKRAFASAGFSSAYVDRLLGDIKISFDRFRATIASMAKALPNRHFVLRPHPFENPEIYRTQYAGIPNISVRAEGSVFHAVANAACIVHLNCGTAVESALMGRVPINLSFLSTAIQDAHTPLPAELSLNVRSEEEAIAVIEKLIARAGEPPEVAARLERAREVIRPWFGTVDGHAAQRVAEGIIRTLANNPAAPQRSLATAVRMSHARPSTGQLAFGALSVGAGSHWAGRLRGVLQPARRGKDFTARDVEGILSRLQTVDVRFGDVTCGQAQNPWSRLPLASVRVDPGTPG